MIGAWSAGLLGLAAPAMASDLAAQPAPASSGAENGSTDGATSAEEPDGTASGANGPMLIMTLSKRQPEPEPRTANPGELSKHALSKRPPRGSN